MQFAPVIAEIQDWCRGRSWLARLPVWYYLLYVGMRQFVSPGFGSLFSAINLCIHEGGHILLRPFGDLAHVAGGTLAQLAAPLAAAVILGRQRDYFGIAFALGWLSTNLVGIGWYMADARAMELPLVTAEEGGAGGTLHDWNFLFGRFGLLPEDEAIGLAVRGAAAITMVVALAFGAWLLVEMMRPAVKPPPRVNEPVRLRSRFL